MRYEKQAVKTRLSNPERLVLFALTENANRTNAEVAERVDMKESTVAEHRRNLLKSRQMFFANFPTLNKLGCEFIAEFFGHTNPATPPEEKNRIYQDFFKRTPQVFDSVSSETFLMASAAFKNISEMLQFREQHDVFFEDSQPWKGLMNIAIFPFEISRACYKYNFAPTLHRIFKLDIEKFSKNRLEHHMIKSIALSKIEMKALYEIVANPDATDAEIGHKIKRSRQSVTDMKHSFLVENLFTRVAVPAFKTQEFGAIAYVHLRFKPTTTFDRKMAVAGNEWWTQSVYTLERNSELFAIYIFSNFKEYASLIDNLVGPFQKLGILSQDPDITIISLENQVDLVDSVFAPLVHNLLF